MQRNKVKYVPRVGKKQELLELLYTKEDMTAQKARNLIFYGVPMSLIRWANYLTADEMDIYLEVVREEKEEKLEEIDF